MYASRVVKYIGDVILARGTEDNYIKMSQFLITLKNKFAVGKASKLQKQFKH